MPVKLPKLSLRQLHIFVAIAEQGATTAASEAIALSQSAVSAALHELERLMGKPDAPEPEKQQGSSPQQ